GLHDHAAAAVPDRCGDRLRRNARRRRLHDGCDHCGLYGHRDLHARPKRQHLPQRLRVMIPTPNSSWRRAAKRDATDWKHILLAGLALAAAGSACAQNIEWRQEVYAEVVRADHGGAVEQVPFYPYWSAIDLPLRVMQVSQEGTSGIVLAGSA